MVTRISIHIDYFVKRSLNFGYDAYLVGMHGHKQTYYPKLPTHYQPNQQLGTRFQQQTLTKFQPTNPGKPPTYQASSGTNNSSLALNRCHGWNQTRVLKLNHSSSSNLDGIPRSLVKTPPSMLRKKPR